MKHSNKITELNLLVCVNRNWWLPILIIILIAISISFSFVAAVGANASNWWHVDWEYRVSLSISAGGYERYDKPVEMNINFSQLLDSLGQSGVLDLNSIRVVEVNATNQVIDDDIPLQFDPEADFDASSKAAGTLIFIMEGNTLAAATRYYHIYFDLVGESFTPPSTTPQIILTDNITDEGQSSFQIATANGTYYYQKQAAGFSSLLDSDGNDWIDYHPTGGSAGNYRGIPNLVYPEGHFHPGSSSATSSIVSQGPIKIKIHSATTDNKWETMWEIYPDYAKLTVLKIDHNYWFLYEGTPGGALDTASDFMLRPDGTQTLLSASWNGDIPNEEWVYFSDPNVGRSLFLAHHEDDESYDSYRQMDNNMTVFGLGRQNLTSHMSLVPAHFTIGFMDDLAFASASKKVHSAYKDLTVTIGAVEQRNQPPIASFTAMPALGEAPLTVDFDATTSTDPDGTIGSYAWSFGDTITGSGVMLGHEYTVVGTYTVTLTVTDNEGAADISTTTIIVNQPVFSPTKLIWLPLVIK